MAKAKGKTPAKVSSKPGKEAAKSVQQSIDLMDNLEEPKVPVIIQSEVDQKVRDILNDLGATQSKYQQLGVLRKSKGLRGVIKVLRNISNDFR